MCPGTNTLVEVTEDEEAQDGVLSMAEGSNDVESASDNVSKATEEASTGAGKAKKKKPRFCALYCDFDVLITAAKSRGWAVVRGKPGSNEEEICQSCNVHWVDNKHIHEAWRRIEPWMKFNHFPGMNNALARKGGLARSLGRMQRAFPADFRFLPQTWVVPDDMLDLERQFIDGESRTAFICKPDHNCQGRGIFITHDLDKIKKAVAAEDQPVVVQRYLQRPMLLDGLKFDLRLYLLVGAVLSPETGQLSLRLFLFKDGLVRLCTTPYSAPTRETEEKRCMHLTNYAVNKKSSNFEYNTDADNDGAGSKRSLRWFLQDFEEQHGQKEAQQLWGRLSSLCVKMMVTAWPNIESEYKGTFPRDLSGGTLGCRSFELLGVDVMVDEKHKAWLIEVNHLPSFGTDTPLDEDIKTRVVEQTLELTCSKVAADDKANYDLYCKKRRERQTCQTPSTEQIDHPQQGEEPLDQPTYGDFERVYPPPEGSSKAETYEKILERAQSFCRPLHQPRIKRLGSQEYVEPPPRGSLKASLAASTGFSPCRKMQTIPASSSSSSSGGSGLGRSKSHTSSARETNEQAICSRENSLPLRRLRQALYRSRLEGAERPAPSTPSPKPARMVMPLKVAHITL